MGEISREHQQLIERVSELGEGDQVVERGAGIPACFLNKARRGEREGPKAASSWDRLAAWLSGRATTEPSPGPVAPSAPAAPAQPTDAAAEAELLEALRSVEDGEELLEVDRKIFVLAAKGVISVARAKVLFDGAKEVRQALEFARGEKTEKAIEQLVPMTLDEAEEFFRAREAKAKRPLGPGEGAPPPSRPAA
jgi:hypothetical protein